MEQQPLKSFANKAMKLPPLPSQINDNRKAIFWALLSQTIWLPVFVAGSQEDWSSRVNHSTLLSGVDTLQGPSANPSISSSLNSRGPGPRQFQSYLDIHKQNTGLVLNSLLPRSNSTSAGSNISYATGRYEANKLYQSAPSNPTDTERVTTPSSNQRWLAMNSNQPGLDQFRGLSQRLYSRSELLGGELTLEDLNEPVMPPLARAERAQWSRSGDPLSPLPPLWREPMRKALHSLTQNELPRSSAASGNTKEKIDIDTARFIHVPSTRIRRASEVPLALQADGSVDILSQPDDPAVIEEINRWSAKQKLPAQGKIRPAVIQLHPMEPLEIVRNESKGGNHLGNEASKLQPSQAPAPRSIRPEPAAVSPSPGGAASEPAAASSRVAAEVPTTTAPASSAAPIPSSPPASVSDVTPNPSSEAES
ncbi:MAG: hypothetical protein VKO39_03730 [Cyanobacteriota bacterium]|nr:hypothetical protein [Cyanobacteriota bacterium]